MNKALSRSVRQGVVLSEDETGRGGLVKSIVRIKETDPVCIRKRGPRTFEEIPPSELQAVARLLSEQLGGEPGSDEHLRAVLAYFDLKRLTTSVGTSLLEALEMRFPYVDDLVKREQP